MAEFLIAAGVLGAVTVCALVWPLLRAGGKETGRASRDAAVFRDQLAELDRDIARGLISKDEAQGSRAEISRRLIAASRAAEGEDAVSPAPMGASQPAALFAMVLVPVGAAILYLAIGRPDLEDAPFTARSALEQRAAVASLPGQRLSQDEAAALAIERGQVAPRADAPPDVAARLAQIKAHLDANPAEIEGRRLLAGAYLRLNRFSEAAELFAEIQRQSGPRADTGLMLAQTEAMVLAAGGYISPEAEAMIRSVLDIEPKNHIGRYFAGLLFAQRGNTQRAVQIWDGVLADSPQDAPWVEMVRAMRARAAPPSTALPSLGPPSMGPPSAEASPGGQLTPDMVEAVQSMSPEERAAFMADRLASLEERLTTEGGTPEEWVMLIRSYQASGKPGDATRIYALSQAALDGGEAGFVREQSLLLGVIAE